VTPADDLPGAQSLRDEVLELAGRSCDDRMTETEAARLSDLLRQNPELIAVYAELMQLHGQLLWDTGHGAWLSRRAVEDSVQAPPLPAQWNDDRDVVTAEVTKGRVTVTEGPSVVSVPVLPGGLRSRSRRRRNPVAALVLTVTLCVCLGVFAVALQNGRLPSFSKDPLRTPVQSAGTPVRPQNAPSAGRPDVSEPPGHSIDTPQNSALGNADPVPGTYETIIAANPQLQPDPAGISLEALHQEDAENLITTNDGDSGANAQVRSARDSAADRPAVIRDGDMIREVDRLLQQAWQDNNVTPVAPAADDEWLRRVYLTFVGAIPGIEEIRAFQENTSQNRRAELLQQLSSDSRTAAHLAQIWVNLLIGRSNPRNVDQNQLYSWLLSQFAENRPWIDTVGELIAAEGRSDQNGATNFLLAHLNDQATPATAVTARLFFGTQVHCTQCHDHPFSKDVRQTEFWELNAFFKQTTRVPVTSDSTAMSDRRRVWLLSDRPSGGMTFFETLRGEQVAVLPEFAGQKLTAEDGVRRRAALAKILHDDPDLQVARAMVNRLWAHCFGVGFTTPVDDMGPHNPVSHPELLQLLSRSFADSGYDLRRLMLWIASSDAWQRSSAESAARRTRRSQTTEGETRLDDPGAGDVPLFTRIYTRSMQPEQVYDSIHAAVRSLSGNSTRTVADDVHRRRWVSQFVASYDTDENDEQLQFDGDITQALLMMNGEDIEQAIPAAIQAMLQNSSGHQLSIAQGVERLSLAVLSRQPTEIELRTARIRQQQLSRTVSPDVALRLTLEDLLWAYLNSSEFISVH
jgi:hypothetical protein